MNFLHTIIDSLKKHFFQDITDNFNDEITPLPSHFIYMQLNQAVLVAIKPTLYSLILP